MHRQLWRRFILSDTFYFLLLALAVALAFFPLLFQGQMLSGDERVDGYYQYSIFYSNAIHEGTSFLWNPHSYGGFPTYLNQFGGFLFPPIYILFKLLPPLFAFHLVIALAVFGGLVFSYLFGRAFFLSRPASFILALSYCLVQVPDTFHLGLSYAHSFMLLPLILFALVKAKQSRSTLSFLGFTALGGLGVGVGFLAGYFVTFMYLLVFSGIFALFLDFFGGKIGFHQRFRALPALLGALVIGLALGFPQLIALYDYSSLTSRTPEFAREMGVSSGVEPLDFVRLVLPQYFQYPFDPGKGFFYLGFLPAFFVFTALLFSRNILVLFFGVTYLVFIAFAMNLPVAEWINVNIPPFSRMGGVSRWLLPGAFAPAYLAGYGFDRLATVRQWPAFIRFWKIFCVASLFGLLGFVLLQVPLQFAASSKGVRLWLLAKILEMKSRSLESLPYPPDHYVDVLGQQLWALHHTFSFSNPYFVIFIALIVAGLLAINFFIHAQIVSRVQAAFVLIIFLVFVTTFRAGLGNTVPISFYFSREPVVADSIKSRGETTGDYRYISFTGEIGEILARSVRNVAAPTPKDTSLLMRELLYRETGTAYGFRNIAGFEPIRSMRQNQLIDTVLAPLAEVALDIDAITQGAPIDRYVNSAILKKVSSEEKSADIEKRIPLLSMMNVKYILSLYPLSDSRLKEIPFQRVPELLTDYYLYENVTVLPKIYFASYPTLWKEHDDRNLFLKMVETPDFTRRSIIECTDCPDIYPAPGKNTIAVTSDENGILAANVMSAVGGWLILSESNLPGWIAEVDDKRVPIKTANYLFQAIYVPKGNHMIEFRYVGSFALFLERVGLRTL